MKFSSANQPPEFLTKYSQLLEKSKAIEDLLPRKIESGADLKKFSPKLFKDDKAYEKADIIAINEGILKPVYDLIDRGGKRWRPSLGMLFA